MVIPVIRGFLTISGMWKLATNIRDWLKFEIKSLNANSSRWETWKSWVWSLVVSWIYVDEIMAWWVKHLAYSQLRWCRCILSSLWISSFILSYALLSKKFFFSSSVILSLSDCFYYPWYCYYCFFSNICIDNFIQLYWFSVGTWTDIYVLFV